MVEKRHYVDFFTVPQEYTANMTREAINETPETWLDFYPHIKYVEFLNTLLQVINGGSKSIWLTGNYGTGKSNAALVTQKLFMDDEVRVRKWFDWCKGALSDGATLLDNLLDRRSEGTLVVYDYNALGVGPNDDFIVRLERGIETALAEKGMFIPSTSNTNEIITRLHREGQKFFETRDSMQGELAYLNASIKTVDQLVTKLQQAPPTEEALNQLLSDVQKVFHKDKIYLDTDATAFKSWVSEIVTANELKRIVFIFDEFHPFIEANKENLKTFEQLAEDPGLSHFYFVPVTHMSITAYFAEGSANAKKSNDRFHFRNLQMPNDTAFKLAAHAMKAKTDNPSLAEEWRQEKNTLWEAVRGIAEVHFKPEDVSKQSFYDILPIHPMTAFLLKFLSESARSNQRSIFEYLKGSADGREFQDFIRVGGPGIKSKQFLTADYLWKYFIERDDLGLNKEIVAIRSEFERIKSREFQNRDDDDDDVRVLKAVLLFCLLARLNPDGHERLKPTVENIRLAFQGDGAIVGVDGIIKSLADKHCFSVVNGNIELFATSVGGVELQTKIAEYENKFHDLLSSKTEDMLKAHKKSDISKFSDGRFDVRVSDIGHTTLTNITASKRDLYSNGQNKDTGAVCLWFVVAKNKDEQLQIPDKINSILTQLRDHRIVMFAFPHLTFCDTNQNLWNEYVSQFAQSMLESGVAKEQREIAIRKLDEEWFAKIKKQDTQIRAYMVLNGQVRVNDTSWSQFRNIISDYVRRTLPCCVDYLTDQTTAFGKTALKAWATAGIQFDATSGQYRQQVESFKKQGITADVNWFKQNANHPIPQIRLLIDKKIANTIGKGSPLSVRKIYIELQRAPYGMKWNALSAFVLGIAFRHILDKGYRWDNLQQTGALDTDSLAEIIESVVKDDGQGKIKGEKLICRLSREEKAFVEKAPRMFNIINTTEDARVEDVLLQIQNRVEQISGRVPLWVLSKYICETDEPLAEDISIVLNKICLAGSTSSKSGRSEERSNTIKEVGQFILNNDGLPDTVASYIRPEIFVTAFQIYVDMAAPALVLLAKEVGDVSHGYCQAILGKTAETAGLLWNQVDITEEIDETIKEYEVIKLLKPIAGFSGFVPYRSAIETLREAVVEHNKLPKSLIVSAVPSLSVMLSAISNNGAVQDIKDELEQNEDFVTKLFFDVTHAMSIKLLKQRLTNVTISDSDLLKIYSGLASGFARDENVFLDDVRAKIENFVKNSLAQNIKAEWRRLTDTDTPSAWANSNGIPARFILNNIAEANDIMSAVQTPEQFSSDKLNTLLNILSVLDPVDIVKCHELFRNETVPSQFAKFNISLPALLDFLRNNYGNQPNNWPPKLDVGDFVRREYKGTFAPQVTDKIKKTSAEDLKSRLLQLAQDNPELGLLFWE